MLSIVQQQCNLKRNGYYYIGSIDGIKGNDTVKAIKAYQKAEKIAIDGVWGVVTEKHSLADAKALQKQLNSHGAKLIVDGILGNTSEKAIKNFQRENELKADGIVGPTTKKTLEKSHAKVAWKDIKYFKESEFKCDCGGRYCSGFPVRMNMGIVKILDEIRDEYKQPIIVTSGVRCKKRNAEVGGVYNSEHLKGKAVDFYIPDQNDTAIGRQVVVKKAYALGVKYAYTNTPGMGNAVHVNI